MSTGTLRRHGLNLMSVLFGLLLWAALSRSDLVGLPGPVEVAARGWQSLRSSQLEADALASLARVIPGFLGVPGLHELSADEDFYPKISFPNTFVARDDTLQSNPELVRRFVRVLKRAMDWRAANFERSVELSAAFLGAPVDNVRALAKTVKLLTSAELVKLTQEGTVDSWFQNFNDMFKSFGTLKEAIPPSEWYDSKLLVAT